MHLNKLEIKKKKTECRAKPRVRSAVREQNTEKWLTSGLLQQPIVSKTDKARMIKWQGSLWSNRDKRGGYAVFKTLFFLLQLAVDKNRWHSVQFWRVKSVLVPLSNSALSSILAQVAQTALALFYSWGGCSVHNNILKHHKRLKTKPWNPSRWRKIKSPQRLSEH